MLLRKLEGKDAPLMLDWMHDNDVVKDLRTDFAAKTLSDCLSFITHSQVEINNLNLAVVSDEDEYMGTVSLKNIDVNRKNAEFAITIRKCAMGKGYSQYAMSEIIRIAFDKLNLDCVYWCVSRKNIRAVRFYEKQHYAHTDDVGELDSNYEGIEDLQWYAVKK